MAITQPALAHAVARDFLRAAPPEAGIKQVWVWSQHGYIDPERDYVELTVFADPPNESGQHDLDSAAATLHDQYPDLNILLHTFSSRDLGDLEPSGEIREDAQEVRLAGE